MCLHFTRTEEGWACLHWALFFHSFHTPQCCDLLVIMFCISPFCLLSVFFFLEGIFTGVHGIGIHVACIWAWGKSGGLQNHGGPFFRLCFETRHLPAF
jgi:hypothetical protein